MREATKNHLLKMKDEISEKLRLRILAFFDFLSPCWTFLFVHKSKPDESTNVPLRIIRSQDTKNNLVKYFVDRSFNFVSLKSAIPNPFTDEPTDNGPTSSKSYGSKRSFKVSS